LWRQGMKQFRGKDSVEKVRIGKLLKF